MYNRLGNDKIEIMNFSLELETVHEIGKFTILWSEFEKIKCDNFCTVSKLKEIAKFCITSDEWRAFAKCLPGRIDIDDTYAPDLLYIIKTDYILEPEGAHTMKVTEKEAVKLFIKAQGEESIVGGFLALYRLRNNILHGLKSPADLDGQIELFIAMNHLLETIISGG